MFKIISELENGQRALEVFSAVTARVLELAPELAEADDVMVDLAFVDVGEMQGLNLESRGVDKTTDVLSFPSMQSINPPLKKEGCPYDYDPVNEAIMLGQVVICPEVAALQATELGHSEKRELAYLFAHGLLHLLGYDHEDDIQKEKMRELEECVLAGIADR